MLTGTHKNTKIGDELDCDGELLVAPMLHIDDWLTKGMAVEVIKHIAAVFDLSEILAAVEKHEEAKNNAEWCEDHGEDRNKMNAEEIEDDEGYPENDNLQPL